MGGGTTYRYYWCMWWLPHWYVFKDFTALTKLNSVYTIAYKMGLKWDEAKNKSNYKKHGVWFEEAQTTWADPGGA